MLSSAQKQSLLEFAKIAVSRKSLVPVEYSIAVWALESGWGQKLSGKNNCFGIKAYPGCFGKELVNSHEWFSDKELQWFLRTPGCSATRKAKPPRADGKKEYATVDWFATFPSLDACFEKRLSLITGNSLYRPAFEKFQQTGDLRQFVRDVTQHYSTADADGYTATVLSIANSDAVKQAITQAG